MTDPRVDAWARTLVTYSTGVQPGDVVSIEGEVSARPLLGAIYRETLRAGGLPAMIPRLGELNADLLGLGSDEQIAWVSPIDRWSRAEADVFIRVLGEENTKTLSGIDPNRQIARKRSQGVLLKTMMERTAAGECRWTLTLYPTNGYAQDAEMSTPEYTAFVFNACKLGADDPAAAWRRQGAMQQRLIDWLVGKREVRLQGPDTDLRLAVTDRVWINCDGTKNFPMGRSSPVRLKTRPRGTFAFRSRWWSTAGRSMMSDCDSRVGVSSMRRRVAVRDIYWRRSMPTLAPGRSASWPSGRTSTSQCSPRTFSSTRRLAGPCIWRLARDIRRRGAPTSRPFIGI